jgi:regulator of cell morphogenesis and NO signaling
MTDVSSDILGDIVAANPGAARVLDRFGLDFCCHGGDSLDDACAHAGVDPADVRAALRELPVAPPTSWTDLDAPALADHIVVTHHRYLQEELPAVVALAQKVLSVHGERHVELVEVERLVRELHDDLLPHMAKEERVLFPAIHALAAGPTELPFGSIGNPIRVMTSEHEAAGELLEDLRTVTVDYRVPADGCASYRSLYERLEAVERDTHVHIHKENHVLFPAAIALAGR